MTRIAVFSDVHGNTPALRAVLDDIDRRAADVIVDLGDVASGGVDPRGTLDLLRSRPDIVTVRGNHERQLLELDAWEMTASDRLAHAVLDGSDRAWLDSLPETVVVADGVLAVHGSPRSDTQYLLHSVDPNGLREATDEEVQERISGLGDIGLVLCGHTHLVGIRHLPEGPLIVNPGSVGWPAYADDLPYPHVVESGSTAARYSLVEGGSGSWRVRELEIEYDVEDAARRAEGNHRPDVAHALRTGRVLLDTTTGRPR